MNILHKFVPADKLVVVKNFTALSIIQAANFFIPLITLPYFLRVIGTEKFGVIAFAQALMIFLGVIADYGFNVSATREVSIRRDNLQQLSGIFSSVLFTKCLLCLLSFIPLIVLVLFIPKFRGEWLTYVSGFTMVIGQTLLPVWFFQGIEQMKYITYLNLIAKVLFVILIFVMVRTADDYPYILFLNGLSIIVPALLSIWLAIRYFHISFIIPSKAQVRQQLQEGWYVFVSNFSISVYINSNVFILGLFTSNVIVGYYSIAERVVGAVRQLLVVFSQAVYPHVCKLSQITFGRIKGFFTNFFLPFAFLIIIICLGVFSFADEVVALLASSHLPQVSLLLKLLIFVPIIVLFNIPAYQVLLAYNLPRSYMIILTSASVLNILLNSILAYFFQGTGTAVSVIVTELFVTAGLYVLVELKHSELSFFSHSHS